MFRCAAGGAVLVLKQGWPWRDPAGAACRNVGVMRAALLRITRRSCWSLLGATTSVPRLRDLLLRIAEILALRGDAACPFRIIPYARRACARSVMPANEKRVFRPTASTSPKPRNRIASWHKRWTPTARPYRALQTGTWGASILATEARGTFTPL